MNETNNPRHIAFIMDGNGRWAKEHLLQRSQGHIAGAKALEKIIEYCHKINIEVITFYAFSTENWNRPQQEVQGLMNLFSNYLDRLYDIFKDGGEEKYKYSRICFIGNLSVFSETLQEKIRRITELSDKREYKITVNIAVNYGGRDDIVNAVNSFIKRNPNKNINEKELSQYLYTGNQPDPDLIIRTGGELRLSNFLLWQAAYAEYFSSPVYWPDFTPEKLDEALFNYKNRIRKYGGLI
ncbi:MAG: isoprenyl transferase [Clostridia bacterium]|nr:isoprenyl transferase [Clostridia bacterium]